MAHRQLRRHRAGRLLVQYDEVTHGAWDIGGLQWRLHLAVLGNCRMYRATVLRLCGLRRGRTGSSGRVQQRDVLPSNLLEVDQLFVA